MGIGMMSAVLFFLGSLRDQTPIRLSAVVAEEVGGGSLLQR